MTSARAPTSRRSRMPAACLAGRRMRSWANAAGLINGTVRGTQTNSSTRRAVPRAQVAMILMNYVEHVVNA